VRESVSPSLRATQRNTTRKIESRVGRWSGTRAFVRVKEINTEWNSHFKKFVTPHGTARTKLGDFNIFQFAFAQYLRAHKWIVHVNQFVSRRVRHFSRERRITVLNDTIMSTLTSALSLIISRHRSIPMRIGSDNCAISI